MAPTAPSAPAELVPWAEDARSIERLTPGSAEAEEVGCRCPVWLNAEGAGVRTGLGRVEAGTYVADPRCPLHRAP